ncbi:MAG TPA: alpha/beta hydrolase [Casimicrobiaceae bacterium]|nr:alpha/beta hydrolase [Casimicrobiaceae bacterium]
MVLYRGMSRAALDAAYNNRAAVPRYEAIVAQRRQRSAEVRRNTAGRLDLRYGERARQRLDFFPASNANAPVFAYIHGGYWQSTEKESSTYLIEGPLAHGVAVALIEYTIAPEAGMDEIVAEIRSAIDWLAMHARELGGDPACLYVGGHSAGGHLAAMTLDKEIAGVLCISGLFELEPIRLGSLNDNIDMSEASAERNSPLLHVPTQAPPLIVAVGALELPELVRQSADYVAMLQKHGLPARYLPIDGRDHFTVLDELASPDGVLCAALLDLVAA